MPIAEETEMPDEQPTSWRTIVYGTSVISSDDERVGEVYEVLGSDAQDIFHGLRVRLASQGRDVMVAADDVTSISADGVRTRLTATEVQAIGDYNETATYHLASVGWLRKHLGWQQDSKGDEEPG